MNRNTGLTRWLVAWLLLVAGSFLCLEGYAATPGQPARPPLLWPPRSGLVQASDRPTLLVFIHPQCPCSRATLANLERLLARAPGRAQVYLLFMRPGGTALQWSHTDLWRRAGQLKSTRLVLDEGNREAGCFQVATSGQVLLYDASGALRFSGGITPARGHEGDSGGGDALLCQLLAGPKLSPVVNRPVQLPANSFPPQKTCPNQRAISGSQQDKALESPVFGCPLDPKP